MIISNKLTGVKHLLNARHFTPIIFSSLIILTIVIVAVVDIYEVQAVA